MLWSKRKSRNSERGADFVPIHSDAKKYDLLPEFFYGNRLKKGLELGILLAWSMCRYCLKGWYTLC